MFEKVNPSHPDKVADRIAGAVVDLAYAKNENPKVACEVLIGHNKCHIILETSEDFTCEEVKPIVDRIAGEGFDLDLSVNKQDEYLAKNQAEEIRCGDNGIFKGSVNTREQSELSRIAKNIYAQFPTDGKYVLCFNDECASADLIICQSNASTSELFSMYPNSVINPLGDWTGGPNVDTGATNRKLGSDMGDAVTGGGLHGKDLSKADVSVNIVAHLLALKYNEYVYACCAIGDGAVEFKNEYGVLLEEKDYSAIVNTAKAYIKSVGGFEKFAEWGLV